MDLASIFRDTWRITWHSRPLWILSLLMSLTMLPALALAGAFGGAASAISLSAPGYLMGLARLRELPAWAWILIAAGMWVLLVVLTTVSWTLQVAMVRGASLAAEGQPPTLVKALSLGPQRLQSIVKLGLTFGVLMMALSVLPPLAEVLLSQLARGQAGLVGLVPLTQTGLAPVSSALSLALFLVMMSIAVEDLTPRKAFRRTWSVLRYGWWGFLLVFAFSGLPAFALILLVVPLAVALPFAFLLDNGWIIPLVCGAGLAPLGLFILLFTAVFTTTMYTLIYRAAAQLGTPATTPPA